jgi:hypothetical protein
MSQPWFKFQPAAWRGDQALRAVSLAARGLWIECLCIMHEAKPYGHLVLNGTAIGDETLARMTGVPVDEVRALMAELRQAGALSVASTGVVLSRRMVKDHERANLGRKSANRRWAQATDSTAQSGAPNGSANGPPSAETRDSRFPPLIPQGATAPRGAGRVSRRSSKGAAALLEQARRMQDEQAGSGPGARSDSDAAGGFPQLQLGDR